MCDLVIRWITMIIFLFRTLEPASACSCDPLHQSRSRRQIILVFLGSTKFRSANVENQLYLRHLEDCPESKTQTLLFHGSPFTSVLMWNVDCLWACQTVHLTPHEMPQETPSHQMAGQNSWLQCRLFPIVSATLTIWCRGCLWLIGSGSLVPWLGGCPPQAPERILRILTATSLGTIGTSLLLLLNPVRISSTEFEGKLQCSSKVVGTLRQKCCINWTVLT